MLPIMLGKSVSLPFSIIMARQVASQFRRRRRNTCSPVHLRVVRQRVGRIPPSDVRQLDELEQLVGASINLRPGGAPAAWPGAQAIGDVLEDSQKRLAAKVEFRDRPCGGGPENSVERNRDSRGKRSGKGKAAAPLVPPRGGVLRRLKPSADY
jgi:hypothetical protein